MKQPLLERRSPLRISYALLILTVFFFLVPSAFRAGRQSLGKKENDVKDWLPDDFPETAELAWFSRHFVGESFIVATWPGCSRGDTRLRLLERKLTRESAAYDPAEQAPPSWKATYRRARLVGQELSLLTTGDYHRDWGGQDEKWLRTPQGPWYYITPAGRLYRWHGNADGIGGAVHAFWKAIGQFELEGQLVTAFGDESSGESPNPIYNDPALLTAPLFETVQTGDSIIEELASEGGSLWPIEAIDPDRRAIVARRRAMNRMTGTLFAPAVPQDFDWTGEAFRRVVPESRQPNLPETFTEDVEILLEGIVSARFEGSRQALAEASTEIQTEVWYEIFDTLGVEPPPRATCVLLTLTDLGKNHLAYAIGRGVLGGPRGRLLQLAEESGVDPPPPPSMAPPPFNRSDDHVSSGLPPLRLGGPPVDNMAIDEEGTVTLVRLVGYSLLLGIVLSYLCFGSIKITVMIFIVGGTSAMLSMAMVWWTGGRVDAILMSMPSLVYVLGLSGAIHVVNYYREEVQARGPRGAAERALRHALLPCTLASLTTAIGLASLFTSNLAPISNFGLYAAIGVIATLGVLFSYLPAALETFRPSFEMRESGNLGSAGDHWFARTWASIGTVITRHYVATSAICLIGLLIAAAGLFQIRTSVQLLKLFDPESRIIEDYAWLEDNFGKLVPMELVLRVPAGKQAEANEGAAVAAGKLTTEAGSTAATELELLERVEAVSRIDTVVSRTLAEPGLGIVGQTTSAATFLPPLPDPSNRYAFARSQYNRELIKGRIDLLGSDYLRTEAIGPHADSELWRISLRVGALSDVDYGRFIGTLRLAVEPVLRAYDTRDELLRQLSTDADGQPSSMSGKERVLVVGSKRPQRLDEMPLVSVEDRTINTTNIYIATLAELLSGERLPTAGWLDPAAEESLEVGSARWDQLISRFDAVVWVGGEGVNRSDLDSAMRLIDGKAILEKPVSPGIVDGGIPEVDGSGDLQVIYTGVIPVVYKAQRTLLNSLAKSIGLAFVLIAIVMIVLLNPARTPWGMIRPGNFVYGCAAGMLSMIPNLFPVLLVFGIICHLGIAIDIGTMMVASVAMGVAVDDTIHFLTWFRANLDRGLDRVDALIETYRRVGPAMTQTTVVGGLGLFVFAMSTFTPTQRFGTLMLVMLAAALIGDLVLLPALLASPLGRCFRSHSGERSNGSGRPDESVGRGGQEPGEPAETIVSPDAACDEADRESLPQLRVHFPSDRPPARRLK